MSRAPLRRRAVHEHDRLAATRQRGVAETAPGAEHPAGLAAATRSRWLSVLISALGVSQVLLATSAAPWPTATAGLLGGLLLAAAPWLGGRHRLLLGAAGTVPFAVLTATSLVTPLVAVLGVGLLALSPARRTTHSDTPRP